MSLYSSAVRKDVTEACWMCLFHFDKEDYEDDIPRDTENMSRID